MPCGQTAYNCIATHKAASQRRHSIANNAGRAHMNSSTAKHAKTATVDTLARPFGILPRNAAVDADSCTRYIPPPNAA